MISTASSVDPVALDLAQALGDLRLRHPEHPQRVAAQRRRPRQDLPHRLGRQRHRPHRLQLPRRAGQDDHDPLPGRHHQPRRGADRIERDRALRAPSPACGWPPSPPPRRRRSRTAAKPRRISAIFSSICSSSSSSRPAKRATTSAVRSSAVGPEAAGGDDQVHALGGEEAQRRLEVVGAVGDDEDVGDLHPVLGQPFGDPGAVGVGDAPGQDLGSRDDDAGANHALKLPDRAFALSCSFPLLATERNG